MDEKGFWAAFAGMGIFVVLLNLLLLGAGVAVVVLVLKAFGVL